MKFKDGIISITPGLTVTQEYRAMTKLFYDCEIPITKVLGFKVMDKSGEHQASIDRNLNIKENMIQLATNMSKVILPPLMEVRSGTASKYRASTIDLKVTKGTRVTTANAIFTTNGRSVAALNKDVDLCTALEEDITVRLVAQDYTGYVRMEDAVRLIDESLSETGFNANAYYPLNVEFTLIDYVKILPPREGKLHYRLADGFNDGILNMLWERYQLYKK